MKSPTNNHRDNPGWELIIAPFAWLASKIVRSLIRKLRPSREPPENKEKP